MPKNYSYTRKEPRFGITRLFSISILRMHGPGFLYQWTRSSNFNSSTHVLTKNTYCNLCLVVLAGRAVEGLTLRISLESSLDFFSSFEAEITGLTDTSLVSTGMIGDDLQILQRVYTFNPCRTLRLTDTRKLSMKYMARNLRLQFQIEVTVS